jgi:metal-sulfur cluster biosynthetic enzyme
LKPKGHIATESSLSATVAKELTSLVTERLNEVVEEETNRKLGELNVITEVSEVSPGAVRVRFRPLAAYSPLAVDIGRNIRDAALSVHGVKEVRVECSGHMMDELVNKIVNKSERTQKATR